MSEQPTRLRIGEVEVDFSRLSIDSAAGTSSMERKVMAVLQVLVDHAPEVVSRQQLIDTVWASESGGDESLSRAISLLRKAMADDRGKQGYIETIPRRGYRLIAPVMISETSDTENTTLPNTAGGDMFKTLAWPAAIAGVIVLAVVALLPLFNRETTDSPQDPSVRTAELTRSIAVLPFLDLSAAGDQQYFADGLAEEILNAITGLPGVSAAGRRSSFQYRGKHLDLAKIGADLNVNFVLEGSVRKQDDRVRITAQLVRTEDGFYYWSRTFDGASNDIFDLQERIARDIADALKVIFEGGNPERLAPRLTTSEQAHDAFLRGRSASRQFGPAAKARARSMLQRAVELDPAFALAWAELGRTELLMAVTHPDATPEKHIAAAENAVERALALQPELPFAHYVRAEILEGKLSMADCVDAAAKALQLAPGDPFLMTRYGYYLAAIGKVKEGAALMEAGLTQDALDSVGMLNLGAARQSLGDIAEAIRLFRRSYALGFKPAGIYLALALANSGERVPASNTWQRLRTDIPGRFPPGFDEPARWDEIGKAILYADTDARAAVKAALDEYLSQPDSRTNSYRTSLYALIGAAEDFMHVFVSRPHSVNASGLMLLWNDTPESRQIRGNQAFPAFSEQVGLVEAWRRHGWPSVCKPESGTDGSEGRFSC